MLSCATLLVVPKRSAIFVDLGCSFVPADPRSMACLAGEFGSRHPVSRCFNQDVCVDSGLGALVPLKATFPNSCFKEGAMERTRLVQLAEVPYSAGWLFTWHILPLSLKKNTLLLWPITQGEDGGQCSQNCNLRYTNQIGSNRRSISSTTLYVLFCRYCLTFERSCA